MTEPRVEVSCVIPDGRARDNSSYGSMVSGWTAAAADVAARADIRVFVRAGSYRRTAAERSYALDELSFALESFSRLVYGFADALRSFRIVRAEPFSRRRHDTVFIRHIISVP